MRSTLLALALLSTASAFGTTQDKKEVVKATKTVTGTFKGFEVGDYVHAIVRDSKGKETSFFIGGAGVDFFLSINKGKKGSFTYQVVNCFIEEAGGRMDIDRLQSAKFGKQTSSAWWSALKKKMSLDAINKKYEPLVVKATINGG